MAALNDDNLSPGEWDELFALKDAISYAPASVHPDHMERFSALFARTLRGKGNPISAGTSKPAQLQPS